MKGRTKKGADLYHTPPEIFEAMDVTFDLDVAAPVSNKFYHVPSKSRFTKDALSRKWHGFVWMNSPFSEKVDFLNKFFKHGNGVALVPASVDTEWFQEAMKLADTMVLKRTRISFITPVDLMTKGGVFYAAGSRLPSPAFGTAFFSSGKKGSSTLKRFSRSTNSKFIDLRSL